MVTGMIHRNVAAKIWLSIGIFVLGFVSLIALEQFEGRNTEARLRTAAGALFPAALLNQRGEAAFARAVKGFKEAVVLQDASGLSNAARDGAEAVERLRAVATLAGLSRERRAEAAELASSVEAFLADAAGAYGPVVTGAHELGAADQVRMAELASRISAIEGLLARARERSSGDLKDQLTVLQGRSARMRGLGLVAFVTSLAISAGLVNFTIRRSIIQPLTRAAAELAQERDLLRILLDNIPDCIYFKDPKGLFIRVNKALARLLGIANESAANGRTVFDFFDPPYSQEAYLDEQQIVRTGQPIISKIERVRGPGGTRWLTSTKVPVRRQGGGVEAIVGVSRDITEWKEAVEALQASEESFRLLFAAIPHAVWVYDEETRVFVQVNEAAVRHYGYPVAEFQELDLAAIHPPGEAERLLKALKADPSQPPCGAWQHQTKDGRVIDVEVTAQRFEFKGRPAVLAVTQDVTERKRLEVELHQAQRLESVGQLAAGIAHEINTPIQYVWDNLRFMKDAFQARQGLFALYERLRAAAEAGAVPPSLLAELRAARESADAEYLAAELPKAFEQSSDGAERVANIVRAMKEFAHPGQKEKAAADLNRALANALIVARNEYKYVADAETDFGDLPPVVCNISEMNQVFLNLLVNAAHAIAEVTKGTGARGKIVVRTRRAGDRATISISDTGCGIAPSIQARVFDPFFTTKAVGRGSGQGLAIARSIVVERHSGSLSFEPNGSQGTTFTVSIPIEPRASPAAA
jgi:PAS domain S-box-containing protein